jgi:hypothetical protein
LIKKKKIDMNWTNEVKLKNKKIDNKAQQGNEAIYFYNFKKQKKNVIKINLRNYSWFGLTKPMKKKKGESQFQSKPQHQTDPKKSLFATLKKIQWRKWKTI